MSDEEIKLVEKEWVYVGQRVRKGKRVYAWKTDGGVGMYEKPLVAASVGGVFKFYETEDGKTFKTAGEYAPVYLRRHENNDDIRSWAAQDEAAKQELSIKSMNTKAAKVEPLDDLFQSLRKISVTLNSTERRALLARIAEELMRGY